MSRLFATVANAALVLVVCAALIVGVTWAETKPSVPAAPAPTPRPAVAQAASTHTPVPGDAVVTPGPKPTAAAQATAAPQATSQLANVAPPNEFNRDVQIEDGDAPLLKQAPGTLNFLLLGSDAAADDRFARTDSIMVASVNTELPSVSVLSFPRDLQVRMPGRQDDRINTVMEFGNALKYPGGGVSYLGAVMRKNFGIQIDHFVRIDFSGFVKVIDALGGVDVLVECELHETFPDRTMPNGRLDLDFYPGKMTLNGKAALGYSRARYSTSDFDRARRQQKVLRAVFSKARRANLFQNALPLFASIRENIQTDVGIQDVPAFVDIARRMGDLSIKNRVLTYPALKAFTRRDGAQVLLPNEQTLSYIAEALAPPPVNQAQTLTAVEVVNGTGKENMELVAADRLLMEGFNVVSSGLGPRRATTQIVDYSVTPKGSPISRLQAVFNVARKDVVAQADPSSKSAAGVVLGANYDSCPNTYQQSRDVVLQADPKQLIPTPTP